jgi:hypothetical protein
MFSKYENEPIVVKRLSGEKLLTTLAELPLYP